LPPLESFFVLSVTAVTDTLALCFQNMGYGLQLVTFNCTEGALVDQPSSSVCYVWVLSHL